jgi:hypothetical protein
MVRVSLLVYSLSLHRHSYIGFILAFASSIHRFIINNNDAVADKVRKYRADYNNRPPSAVSLMPDVVSTSGRLHSEFVRLLFLQDPRETDHFFEGSGVLSTQSDCGLYHYHRAAVSAQVKSKVGLALVKTEDLRITLNLDGSPIISRTHTHPSHSKHLVY